MRVQETLYSIRWVYERDSFTSDELDSILTKSGLKSKERQLIIRRGLMWGYIVTQNYGIKIVDINKAVRTRTLHHGRHGKTRPRKRD